MGSHTGKSKITGIFFIVGKMHLFLIFTLHHYFGFKKTKRWIDCSSQRLIFALILNTKRHPGLLRWQRKDVHLHFACVFCIPKMLAASRFPVSTHFVLTI